jgi:hypothetical protein
MKKVTFQNIPSDMMRIRGSLYIVCGVSEEQREDENGEFTTEYVGYVVPAVSDNAEYVASTKRKVEKELAKKVEHDSLSNLVVTTSLGNTFDANLESRQNMADAILISESTGTTDSAWRLADNTSKTITITELREAHALALNKYAKIKAIL